VLGFVRVDFVPAIGLLDAFSVLEDECPSVVVPEEADVAVLGVVFVDVWLADDVPVGGDACLGAPPLGSDLGQGLT